MRERVRTEARSALDAGEAGRAGHQERVVYTNHRLGNQTSCTKPADWEPGDERPLPGHRQLGTPVAESVIGDVPGHRIAPFYNRAMAVRLGFERLLNSRALDGKRVGLVCNPSSVDAELRHVADRLTAHTGAQLAALFGPQHGFRSDVQENMIETGHARDEARRVPIYSLYSETREPTAEMLGGLDVLVIDLQDVGTRIYTYIYTMANCLQAARKHGVKAIVCDRPNPIGGVAVEGPLLVAGFESFVGLYPIPMRHGMTIGELARLFNEHFGIGADLDVALMEGWRRDLYYDATGLPWVLPSPNIPTLETRDGVPGNGAVRRHERVRRAGDDETRSSWSGRRGSAPSASRTR